MIYCKPAMRTQNNFFSQIVLMKAKCKKSEFPTIL